MPPQLSRKKCAGIRGVRMVWRLASGRCVLALAVLAIGTVTFVTTSFPQPYPPYPGYRAPASALPDDDDDLVPPGTVPQRYPVPQAAYPRGPYANTPYDRPVQREALPPLEAYPPRPPGPIGPYA